MTKKALITGATGLLGREVVKAFRSSGWDVTGTGFSRATPPAILKVDLGSAEEISKVLDYVEPGVVVHCAANRMPDKCDLDPDGTRALNVRASRALAEATVVRSILLIYISTDYVFPGVEGEAPYEADAQPRPPNLYGQTKLDGERAVLDVTKDKDLGVVLRIPVLYGPAATPAESAVNTLLSAVHKAQDEKVTMDDWSIRYPTHTEDVARVLQDVASTYLPEEARSFPKILQFSSEHRTTKYQICVLLADILGLPLDNMTANKQGNDPGAAVQRPYDCHLSTKVLKGVGVPVHAQSFEGWWRHELRAYRK
ncbi:MAG: hypothetical protein M1832_002883 [Thelocarpon impressellum]|nr:MAG: hypothetical protein M1832_002883 [Thelocarpon impressellum]